MFLVWYSLLNSDIVYLFTRTPPELLKRTAEVALKKEQELDHGEFFSQWKWDNNLDEGLYNFKTKSKKFLKQHF